MGRPRLPRTRSSLAVIPTPRRRPGHGSASPSWRRCSRTRTSRPRPYYYRLKAYDSAILYLKDIAASYPRASVTPQVLLTLVQAYQKRWTTPKMWRRPAATSAGIHPATPGVDQVCPVGQDTAAAAPTGTR